jgi:hypothetical protein
LDLRCKELKRKLWPCTCKEQRVQLEQRHWSAHRAELQELRPVGDLGWINQGLIARHAFPPAADTRVFVCGLPSVYESLCGPRTEKELTAGTALHALRYSAGMVVKF